MVHIRHRHNYGQRYNYGHSHGHVRTRLYYVADKHWEALELDRGASESEVKEAFRRAARECHPDVNNSPNATLRWMAVGLRCPFPVKLLN